MYRLVVNPVPVIRSLEWLCLLVSQMSGGGVCVYGKNSFLILLVPPQDVVCCLFDLNLNLNLNVYCLLALRIKKNQVLRALTLLTTFRR